MAFVNFFSHHITSSSSARSSTPLTGHRRARMGARNPVPHSTWRRADAFSKVASQSNSLSNTLLSNQRFGA
eukprot:1793626-Rhodomonas_salina.1